MSSDESTAVAHQKRTPGRKLVITALGIVFGDIGTSPTYAFRDCFDPRYGIEPNAQNILGLLSLIIWSLILVISVKYVGIITKADNKGEGGVMALSALVLAVTKNWRLWGPVGALGIIGAALFFGDGFITPPVSILGAMEGLLVVAPAFHDWIMPAAVVVLTILFMTQRRGTGAIGRIFGPLMLVWFSTLLLLGIPWIVRYPDVLGAINPLHAVTFFVANGGAGFVVLASAFLAVTGGEALYADLGHFGRPPIKRAWFLIVFPALVINYLGQGALVMHEPTAITNPFFNLAVSWLVVPITILATAAAVIASQAVISGVFSITSQAVNLGYLPRLRVMHSSAAEIGQVYVPSVNWILFVGSVGLTLAFKTNAALAGAYGIAISISMLIDGLLVILLLYFGRHRAAKWQIPVLAVVIVLDVLFVSSNALKFIDGGWVPIVVALLLYLLMTTWQEGRKLLNWQIQKEQVPVHDLIKLIRARPPLRAEGTAVYLSSESGGIPRALSNNLRFNRVLHERNVLLTFSRPEIPYVDPEERIQVRTLDSGLYQVIARYGFMEAPNVVAALRSAEKQGVPFDPENTVYVIGRENPIFAPGGGMPGWRKKLFAYMGRNSQLAATHFGVPSHRLLEISSQVKL
jgi:KUP system potassium uptake protein